MQVTQRYKPTFNYIKQFTDEERDHLVRDFGITDDQLLVAMIEEQKEMFRVRGDYPCETCFGVAKKFGLLGSRKGR